MPRPLKNITTRRTKRVEVRLTEAEEITLLELSSGYGLSISDLIRKAALGIKPKVQMATPERASFIKGLAELGKIGSNVNQVAKALNVQVATGQEPVVSEQLVNHTLATIQTLSAQLLQHLTNGHQR